MLMAWILFVGVILGITSWVISGIIVDRKEKKKMLDKSKE
jgi:hypothetical protein